MREINPANPCVRIERTAHSGQARTQGVTSVTLGLVAALVFLLAAISGCGNKGDLFLPSDVVAAEELEDAEEKLKKRQPATTE